MSEQLPYITSTKLSILPLAFLLLFPNLAKSRRHRHAKLMRCFAQRQQQPALLIATRIQRQLLVTCPDLEFLPFETQLGYGTPEKRRWWVVVRANTQSFGADRHQQGTRSQFHLGSAQFEDVSVDRLAETTCFCDETGSGFGSRETAMTAMGILDRTQGCGTAHPWWNVVLGAEAGGFGTIT